MSTFCFFSLLLGRKLLPASPLPLLQLFFPRLRNYSLGEEREKSERMLHPGVKVTCQHSVIPELVHASELLPSLTLGFGPCSAKGIVSFPSDFKALVRAHHRLIGSVHVSASLKVPEGQVSTCTVLEDRGAVKKPHPSLPTVYILIRLLPTVQIPVLSGRFCTQGSSLSGPPCLLPPHSTQLSGPSQACGGPELGVLSQWQCGRF